MEPFSNLLNKPLVELSHELNQIFQNAAVVLILVDKQGRVVNINRAGAELVGVQKNELVGLLGGQVFKCINALDGSGVVCGRREVCERCSVRSCVTEVFSTGKPIYKREGELEVEGDNEKMLVLQLVISAAIIKSNGKNYVLLTIDDITEQKQQEKKLKELLAIKDKFFSIIAHDLRNPFNTLLGFSEILKDQITNFNKEAIQEIAETMNKSAKRTFELVENLLKWSKSQRGKIEFNPYLLNLHNLSRSVFDTYEGYALQKKVTLINSVPLEYDMVADEPMLRTIMRNLLHNAIKFSHEGGTVLLEASFRNHMYELVLSDTGIGMKTKQVQDLFRIDKPHSTLGTKNEKGSGLGLILCHEFVDKHKGEILVNSELGKGTTFRICIPVSISHK